MDLANHLNWDLVVRKTYTVQVISEKEYKPVPAVSFVVNSPLLQIGISSKSAKPYWFLGAYLEQRLLISPSSTSEFTAAVQSAEVKKVGLDRLTLVQFPDFGLYPYLLIVKFPYWLKDIFLEVWKYTGSL